MQYSRTRIAIISVLVLVCIGAVVTAGYFFLKKDLSSQALSTLDTARASYNQNNFETAIAIAEASLAEDPNNVSALLALGTAWAQRGAFEFKTEEYGAVAIEKAQMVLSLEPKNAEAYRVIGYAYETQGKYELAEENYTEALALAQNTGLLHLDLGRLNETLGDIESAYEHYLQASAEGVDQGRTYLGLGRVQIAVEDMESAKESLERSYTWAENIRVKAEASYLLGTLYLREESYARAKQFMDQAVSADDSYALGYVGLAQVSIAMLPTFESEQRRSDAVRSALQSLQKATTVNPNQTIAYVWAARVFEGIGNTQEAALAYRRAQEALSQDSSLTPSGRIELQTIVAEGIEKEALVEDSAILGVSARALTAGGGGDFIIACPDTDCGIVVPPVTTTTTTTTNTSGATVADSCPAETTTTTATQTQNYTIAERTINNPKAAVSQGARFGAVQGRGYPNTATANYFCETQGFVWGVESYETEVTEKSYARGNQVGKIQGAVRTVSHYSTGTWTLIQTNTQGGGRNAKAIPGTPTLKSVLCKAPPPGTFFIGNECAGVQCHWGNNPATPISKAGVDAMATYMCRVRGYETFVDYWSRPKTSTAQGHIIPVKTPYPPTTPMTSAQIIAAAKSEATERRGDPSCTSNCWYRLGIVSCKLPEDSSSSTNNPPASCNLPITAQLSANKTSVTPGEAVNLSYSSTNATSCTLNQGIGSLSSLASGVRAVNPQSTTTYTLTCVGTSGTATDSVTVNVGAAVPTASLTPNPSSVIRGQSATLTWSATNANSCTGSGFSTGNATSGSVSVSPQETTLYGLTCAGANGTSATRYATLTVLEPTSSISASSSRVNPGDTITISWNAENVESCSINGPGISLADVEADASGTVSGSQEVTITAQSTYIISCSPGSASSQSATIINVVPTFEEF